MNINIYSSKVEAKRNFPPNRNPDHVDINTNISFHGIEDVKEKTVEIGFTINVNYNPGVGQMNLSGKAYIKGEKDELKDVR